MDLNQLFRILKRNWLLLILAPLVLVIVVYFLMGKQPKTYQSETTVYTGIGSGYSIENTTRTNVDFYGTNMQFDNLINIINSRSTKDQTAIRLLAQHLCLTSYNPQYISKINYQLLQQIVPREVKDLVVKYSKTGAERDKIDSLKKMQKQIDILSAELVKKKAKISRTTGIKFNNSNNNITNSNTTVFADKEKNNYLYHTVSYGESLSSLSSRYDISVGELISMNNLKSAAIKPGDRIVISTNNISTASSLPTQNNLHVVTHDETLYSISQKYNVSINDLKSWNTISSDELIIGQSIVVGKFTPSGVTDKKITILLEMKLSLLVVFQILKNNDPKTLLFLRELIEMITIKQ